MVKTMYRKILVPMALSHDLSPEMLNVANALSGEGGEVIALHVYETPQGSVATYLDDDVVKTGYDNAKALLESKLANSPKVRPEIVKGHSARSIIDFAAANGVDCIVMGSHKPGLSDYFLGSTAARVVRHAHCAVHVIRSAA